MNCKCEHLNDESVCSASFSSMVPSLFDYDAYCNSEEHYRCPILISHALRDGYKELMRAS